MASLKLLFIHEIEYQTKVVYEAHEFPEHLVARGNSVTFIDFPETRKSANLRTSQRDRVIAGRVLDDVKLRLVSPLVLGIPTVDRLLATLTFIPLLVRLLKSQRFDAIVLYAVPTFGWQTIVLAKIFKVPLLYRALDVSHKIRESVFEKPIKAAEKFIYHRANRLSANNPAMARYCVEIGSRKLPTEVNLPPLDVSHFRTSVGTASVNRESLGVASDETVVLYMGSFFYFSGLLEVIRSFHDHNLKGSGFKLILVGGGEQDEELRALVSDLKLQRYVVFTGFVDYKVLGDYLQLADIFINPMKPDLVSNTAFPHKMLQYMATGRPIVSTKLSGLFETFGTDSGVTWVDEPEQVISAVLVAAQNKQAMVENLARQASKVAEVLDIDKCIDSMTRAIVRTIAEGVA
jgi:glycosyltransferase involved in cell wall biosynthesis